MADFTTGCAGGDLLDSRKRVNYAFGMVLGEDEFVQEQFYLRSRDHLRVRALHGYGTVAGLAVTINAEDEVEVAPGLAVDPVGRFVCVPRAQCADLAEWLASHQDEVAAVLGSPPALPAVLPLWVVLCYRECPTDEVPVPSEDCRPAADSYVASRILDSFELRLVTESPPDVGETAGGLLYESIARLLEAAASFPSEPDGDLQVIRDELVSWVSSDRPELADAPCLGTDESCILLARLDVELEDGPSGVVATGPPLVDPSERPVILSTRYLQEWLLAVTNGEVLPPGPGPLPGPVPDLDDLGDVAVPTPAPGDALVFDGAGTWRPVPLPDIAGMLRAGDAAGGDLDGSYPNPVVDGLRGVPIAPAVPTVSGQVLTFLNGQWRPQSPAPVDLAGVLRDGTPAGGDLDGTYPNPRVDALRGVPLGGTPTADGQILTFAGGQWRAQAPPGVGIVLPFATLTARGDNAFSVWFHLDFPGNRIGIATDELVDEREVTVHRENETGPGFLTRVRLTAPGRRTARNLYELTVTQGAGLLRFTFSLRDIQVDVEGAVSSLADVARDENITFVGQNPERLTVTVAVAGRAVN